MQKADEIPGGENAKRKKKASEPSQRAKSFLSRVERRKKEDGGKDETK